jgi:hypothetical protein
MLRMSVQALEQSLTGVCAENESLQSRVVELESENLSLTGQLSTTKVS